MDIAERVNVYRDGAALPPGIRFGLPRRWRPVASLEGTSNSNVVCDYAYSAGSPVTDATISRLCADFRAYALAQAS